MGVVVVFDGAAFCGRSKIAKFGEEPYLVVVRRVPMCKGHIFYLAMVLSQDMEYSPVVLEPCADGLIPLNYAFRFSGPMTALRAGTSAK